jgi:protein TonB
MAKRTTDLKETYTDYLKLALLLALIFHIAGFVLMPTYTLHPYKPRTEMPIQIKEIPEQMKDIVEPPPVAKPKLPVAAESDEEAVETIEKTDFNPFAKEPPAPEIETPDFVPYDTPPEPKYWFKPKYPDIARQAGIEGMVILKLLVDTDGAVLKVQVLKSLHPALDQAAVEAAKSWQFSPARQRDKPVRVWVSFPVNFILKEG